MIDAFEFQKPPLAVPNTAKEVSKEILSQLKFLVKQDNRSCLEQNFKDSFDHILKLFDLYQKLVVENHSDNKTCYKGCQWCCYHWVEDVNSFEAQIIAQYIRNTIPHKIEQIKEQCVSDIECIQNLDSLVSDKIAEENLGDEFDPTFLLLSSFYQLKRPCPLLEKDGLCSIYPVRPLTCRVYMSFSDPGRCKPGHINDSDIPTYILDLEEEANEIIDSLHFKFQRFEDDTSLRSLLLKHL
ncbi:YkgJ family cysteine cluster protein [Chitinispirillales bacterium ANBcel5]|uniref:YkgJ family cysteine cluster protein n=1 Tax=Cellulosispirillum alkaliphilum TaxID=3039283 RepID=UPI002A53F6F5|nr:YkgJ family cysteine cluster protein [Chitinispirillales bacterium ANBcel5]